MQQDKRTDKLLERVMQVVDRQLGLYSIRPNSRFLDLYVLNDRNFSWWAYNKSDDILSLPAYDCLNNPANFRFSFSLGYRKFQFPNKNYSVPEMNRAEAYERMFHCIVYACSLTFVPWTVWLDVLTSRGFKNEITLMQSYMRQLISKFDSDENRKAFEGKWIYDRGPRYVAEKDDIRLLSIPERDEIEKTLSDIINGSDPPEIIPEANYVIVQPAALHFLVSDENKYFLQVLSNVSWTVTGGSDWCTFTPSSGSGNSTLRINITENISNDGRSTTITVSSSEALTRNIEITQSGYNSSKPKDKYLRVSQTRVELDSLAQSYNITVTANVGWTVKVGGDEPEIEYYLDVNKTAITIGYQASSAYSESKRSISVTSNATWKAYAEGDKTGFEAMLDNFQSILPNQVSENSTTWNYLSAAYDIAENEWTSDTLGLFSSDNFQEVYNGSDYHGNNEDYKETAHTAMQAWLMASCLAELVPNSGSTDNRQSKLFKKAYELAGGRSTPIYGGFAIKGDPMISRLVAGAIYAYNRHNYTFSQIDTMRSEVGGRPIDITTPWETLGDETYMMGYLGINNIGYDFASNDIFPSAAGPYSENYSRKETQHPSEQTNGQPADQFYPASGNTQVWYNRNYKIDVAVDNEVVEHYRLDAIDSYLERTVLAVADDSESVKHRLANKTYYTCGPAVSGKGLRDSFVPATPSTSGAKYFDGVFSDTITGVDLSNQITDSSGNDTTLKKFFDMLRKTGGIGRKQLYDYQLGRRRPSLGTRENTNRSTTDYHLCWLDDLSIARINGGGTKENVDGTTRTWYVDLNGNGRYEDNNEPVAGTAAGTNTDLFPANGLPSTTYPSGHSAGIWASALFMILILPSRIKQIFKAAYSYSVSRTIVRAHWNSDVMYGRTIGTMMPPLINAVRDTTNSSNDFREIYSQVYATITGDTPPEPGPSGTIGFNIINNSGQILYYNGALRFQIKQGNGENAWDSTGHLVPAGKQVDWPLNPPTDKGEPYQGYYYPHYWRNKQIGIGESKLFTMTSFKMYSPGLDHVIETDVSLSTYCDGNWYFVTSDNPGAQASGGMGGIPAIGLGCAIDTGEDKDSNAFLYRVRPISQENSHIETGKIYDLDVYKANTEYSHWNQIIK